MNFGGGTLKQANFTRSWGITPGSGSATVLGSCAVLPGDDFTLSFGGATLTGVVKNVVEKQESGTEYEISLVDNREKLQWDEVTCCFNIIEIIEDDVSTPGIDRSRRYYSILPEDWPAQKKTYRKNPWTADEILTELFAASSVRYGWNYQSHTNLSKPAYAIDAATGRELGAVVQEVLEKVSLLMTLSGSYQLLFAVKGEGATPTPPAVFSKEITNGTALSNNHTFIKVVGDRNLYQDWPVQLEPSWKAPWQPFVFEPEWISEVGTVFGPFEDSASGRATRAAKARQVTVRDYVKKKADTAYADYGKWGEVCRMDIPAWLYLQHIVWKAYQIKRDYTLNGIDLFSLELKEELLAACDYTTAGAISYMSPLEQYSNAKAFIIVQGQPLDLSDPTRRDVLEPSAFEASARTLWTTNNKFNIDAKNYTVIFDDPVFVPGAGANGLFVFANKDSDLPADHPGKYLVVPNAKATFAAAGVRGSFCFEAERYSKTYGSGKRRGVVFVSGLSYHVLMRQNIWTTELKYDTDPPEDADAKAAKVAVTKIAKQQSYISGGYKRLGGCGTTLTGAIDRVTYTLDGSGLSERVEFSKERPPSNFESERELDRRKANEDVYPNQHALRQEVRDYEYWAKVLKNLSRNRDPRSYASIDQVIRTPVGNVDCAPTMIETALGFDAGEVVFADDKRLVTLSGTTFQGVVTCKGYTAAEKKEIPLATQGVVPVKVTGPVAIGDSIGSDSGTKTCKPGGERFVGLSTEAYTGSQSVLLRVRLGGGGGAVAEKHPFQGYLSPFTGTGSPPANQPFRIRVRSGTVNSLIPSNIAQEFVLTASSTTYFWLVAGLSTTGGYTTVQAVSINQGASLPLDQVPPANSAPSAAYKPIFYVVTDANGITEISQWVKTSLDLRAVVVNYGCGTVTKELAWQAA